MTVKEAALYRRCGYNTIDRNRVAWSDTAPPPGKFRYKLMVKGKRLVPRVWKADVEAAFYAPGEIPNEVNR